MKHAKTVIHSYGVQGVASSNPAAPTNRIKHLGHSSEWPFALLVEFCDFGCRLVAVREIAEILTV